MKQNKLIALISALLFNIVAGTAIAMATGFSPLAIIGGGTVLSAFLKPMAGAMPMAIQKEIWINSIVEGLFADNTFLSKAFNADEFVNQGRTVHIPNAGAPSKVVKNRNTFPATVTSRTDIDLTFDLDNYSTDPIKIDLAETVELSYNKRESVLRQDKAKLQEEISEGILFEWFKGVVRGNAIMTTGLAVEAHTNGATGNRKAFTKAEVKTAMTQFNKDNVPAEGRYLLIDAVMYDQLIDSLTDKESTAFHAAADIKNGIVGKLFSFNIMMRSVVAREELNSPTYYGDIYSFEVRAGGRAMREDVKGLLAIVQDKAE